MRLWTFVGVVCLLSIASAAEAGRWRKGARPAGTTWTQRQTVDGRWCHYRSDETGTNECRWKVSWGCKWSYDSGSNQCTPGADTTQATTNTLTATNGSVTVQSIVDGDANDDTYAAILTVRNAVTGEVVTGKIRLRIPAADPAALTVLSEAVTGLQTTPLSTISGTSVYRPLYRTAGGWQLGGAPAPPGGQTCAVAWNNYASQQFMCFGTTWGQAVRASMAGGIWASYNGAIGCTFAANGNLTAFLTCEAKVVGAGFVYGFINGVFGGPDPNAQWCNGAAVARYLMSQYCEPRF